MGGHASLVDALRATKYNKDHGYFTVENISKNHSSDQFTNRSTKIKKSKINKETNSNPAKNETNPKGTGASPCKRFINCKEK